jgi:hypothetical protein
VSDATLKLLRDAIAAVLDMPKDGLGCVYIIVERNEDGGARVKMGTLGLNEAGVALALRDAVNMLSRPADVRGRISDRGEPS